MGVPCRDCEQKGWGALAWAGLLTACWGGCVWANANDPGPQIAIRVEGSDTMVNIAQALGGAVPQSPSRDQRPGARRRLGRGHRQPDRRQLRPADSSRKMTAKELAAVRASRGAEAKEIIVGYDALAVYVNANNPLDSISLEELAEIYGEGGTITRWSQSA